MTLLRLIPRTLLCLLLALLTFGLSGWLLRPRTLWSVEIPTGNGLTLLNSDSKTEDWIWVIRSHSNGLLPAEALAYDSKSGACMKSIGPSPGFVKIEFSPHGDAIVVRERRTNARTPFNPTKLSIYNAQNGVQLHSKEFDGRAELCADGRTAWCTKVVGKSLSLRVVDLAAGQSLRNLELADGFRSADELDVAVSPDGKLLAHLDPINGDPIDQTTIKVWDVEQRRLLRTIALEREPGDHAIDVRSPDFIDDGKRLRYVIRVPGPHRGRFRDHVFDLTLGRHINTTKDEPDRLDAPLPEDSSENVAWTLLGSVAFGEIWTAFDEENRSGWFGVFRSGQSIVPWRRIPFPIMMMPIVSPADPDDEHRTQPPHRWLVAVYEPPLSEALPQRIQESAPASLHWNETRQRLYWFDLDRNDWRPVGDGCTGDESVLRPNSVVTLDKTSDELHSLRRWPLPPRDPRLPSTLIALASSAALWLLLARRARRRALKHPAS